MSTFIFRAHSDPLCLDALCCWYRPVSENPTTLTKGCCDDSVALLPCPSLCSPGDPRLLGSLGVSLTWPVVGGELSELSELSEDVSLSSREKKKLFFF